MHVVVAGASGRTGRMVVEQAVAAGHRVTALVRDPARLEASSGVDVQVADVVSDPALSLPAGADVVISALGMRPDGRGGPVCRPGTANLISAMGRNGISRIAVVSAVPAYTSGPGEPWWFRLVRTMVRRRMPDVYDDIQGMEKLLQDSSSACRWTIVRPGYLVDGERTSYRLLEGRNATTSTHRADLAHALLSLAAADDFSGCAYGIQRGRVRREVTSA